MKGPEGMFTAHGMAHFETDKMGDAEKREHKILGMKSWKVKGNKL